MKRSLAVVAVSAFAMIGLVGCGGAAAAQTTEQACEYLTTKITDQQGLLEGLDMSDPDAVADVMTTAIDTMRSAGDGVTNTEVKEAFTSVIDSFEGFAGAISGGDMGDMSGLTDMAAAAEELEKLCPGINDIGQ